MTTEATTRDPVIEAWSDDLEEGLVEAGMDEASAHAYRQAFELGLTRVISQTATRQELQDGLAQVRGEVRDLRGEMGDLRGEVNNLSREMGDLRGEVNNLRGEMGDLRRETIDLRREMGRMGERLRAEMKEMGDQLRSEMKEIRDQLQREMDLRFGELQKRLNLMTWTMGLGFAGMLGMMGAILSQLL